MIRHSHERRSRPARPVRFTADDVTAWRRFLKAADAAAAKPSDDVLKFARAAEKAGKLALPPEHGRADSPFVLLVRLGKSWGFKTGVERIRAAVEIEGLTRGCAAILEALAPTQPRLPYAGG